MVSPEEMCPLGVGPYVTIIQDMYNDCETLVSTRAGHTEYFHVRVGLHQGSALSPLLFILIMDGLRVGQKLSCSKRDGERRLSSTD